MSLEELKAELKALLASWEYAYARAMAAASAITRATGTSGVVWRTSAP